MTVSAQIVDAMRVLSARGLNAGTSGNISVRTAEGLLVTPSAVPPEALTPEGIVALDALGGVVSGGVPTSEWRIHRDVYDAFPSAGAIVHTHSTYATALAVLREDLPAFHYQVAKAGGHVIRCSTFAMFGTQGLSTAVIEALGDRTACLMANHGMLAYGATLDRAVALATEVEVLCRQYLIARSSGVPVILTSEQMDDALDRFSRYGQPEGG